jgi:hypothetical protein
MMMQSQPRLGLQFGVTVKISRELDAAGSRFHKRAKQALSTHYNTIIMDHSIARHQGKKDDVYWTFNGPNDTDYDKVLRTPEWIPLCGSRKLGVENGKLRIKLSGKMESDPLASLFKRFQKSYDASVSLHHGGEIRIEPRITIWKSLCALKKYLPFS